MPNKLTDAEVKKALEKQLEEVVRLQDGFLLDGRKTTELETLLTNALDLINRQEFRIHQQEKTIMKIQNANLIDFKATIGNYIAENESLKAEVERLQNTLDDILDRQPILVERSEKYAKAEAYKEAFEKVKEELKNIARIDWQGGYYYLIGEAFFDNLLNELVGGNNE